MTGHGTRIELSDDWNENGWFSFPRKFIRDATLSWKAKGIAALLASHSATFKFSATELERWARDKRDGTAAGVQELEAAGYLVRERQSSGEMVYRLFPEPHPEKPEEAGGEPYPEKPGTEIPVPEKPGVYKETTPKETNGVGDPQVSSARANTNTNGDGGLFAVDAPSNGDAPASEHDGPTFDEFWSVYPLKKAKQGARQSWERALFRVPKADRAERARAIVAGAKRYAEDPDRTAKYTAHPTTWLNQGRWEDEQTPVGSGRTPRGGGGRYRDSESYPDAAPWFDPAALEDS